MGGFCTPTYTKLPDFKETVEGTEIPSWVAAAGRTLFERSAELAGGITLFMLALERRRILVAAS
jgi:hypothetical protein